MWLFLKKMLKAFRDTFIQVPRFRSAYSSFLKSPKRFTSMEGQQLLRGAFVATKGKSLKWASALWRQTHPNFTPKLDVASSLFANVNDQVISEAVDALNKDGFWILPEHLPDDWINEVTRLLRNLNVSGRGNSDDTQTVDSLVPKVATYWHDAKDLEEIHELRRLINDGFIREIIGRYLHAQPVYDMCTAWWTFPVGSRPDEAAAQLFHFDLDRVKWLKVFVYLTDVCADNGPHAFIRGSHKTVGLFVQRDGRYSDSEVFKYFSRDDEVRFLAPKGTVFIEDTLGLHKGVPVEKGHRGVFEFQYSINSFGYPYPVPSWETVDTGA
jgi:hypothetical protein